MHLLQFITKKAYYTCSIVLNSSGPLTRLSSTPKHPAWKYWALLLYSLNLCSYLAQKALYQSSVERKKKKAWKHEISICASCRNSPRCLCLFPHTHLSPDSLQYFRDAWMIVEKISYWCLMPLIYRNIPLLASSWFWLVRIWWFIFYYSEILWQLRFL